MIRMPPVAESTALHPCVYLPRLWMIECDHPVAIMSTVLQWGWMGLHRELQTTLIDSEMVLNP
ncbi:MAG: hypothetical protein C3L25_01045 [Candidatus Sedimenticola endophacoides]|nr:MAG: hypothetical protein C3L26_01085 [Candidatus Sedimenticola endophacoides]PUE05384.1 MAG: hypothetical protein C3L25_01045 [Candidatus Sedimenticola endophacoides]